MPFISLWQPVINAAVAGSATALGGALVLLLPKTPSDRVISYTLSFAAGVMATVSIADLWFPTARQSTAHFIFATLALIAGAAATSLLSRLPIPEADDVVAAIWGHNGGGGGTQTDADDTDENEMLDSSSSSSSSLQVVIGGVSSAVSPRLLPLTASLPPLSRSSGAPSPNGDSGSGGSGGGNGETNVVLEKDLRGTSANPSGAARARAWRLGFLLWVVLTFHNLPEGLAVGVSSVKSKELGIMLASAIFLHNVAEGVVIAVPLLAATQNPFLALGVTAASGLSEPVGALLGVLILRGVAGERGAATIEFALNFILCAVGGVMLQVSRAELIPHALRLASLTVVAQGFFFGAVLIASSLYFLPM